MTKQRNNIYLKQVSFADGTVYKVESDVLRSYIIEKVMDALLPFDEGLCVLRSQFPLHPISGFIQCCFEWISRYTYVQHNYLLFAFHIPEQFDCKDIEIAMKIGRNCVCMINKYTYEIFIVNFRFSEEVFKGTLLDGILIKDNCIYPDYFEFTLPSEQFDENKFKNSFKNQLDEIMNKFKENEFQGNEIQQNENEIDENKFQGNEIQKDENEIDENKFQGNEIQQNEFDENENEDEIQQNEFDENEIEFHKIKILDKKRLKENYENAMKEKDYNEIFKQQRSPSRHMFYIQAVYQLNGQKIPYSPEKLVDSISYKTLLQLQTFLSKYWINDEWFQPFELKNCVDTMYYTRHTQVDLRNPFHNDYLRYQPNITTVNDDETLLYDHFLPKMTQEGQLWKDMYYLSGKSFECILKKSEFPYVYELFLHNNLKNNNSKNSNNNNSKNNNSKNVNLNNPANNNPANNNPKNNNPKNNPNQTEKRYARLMTLEHHRYIRVILNKIHTDKTKPLRMTCKRIHCRKTGKVIAWMPVLFGQLNSK